MTDAIEYDVTRMFGGDLRAMPVAQLRVLITVAQVAFDQVLHELERRDALAFHDDGQPVVPYLCDYVTETVIDRTQELQ